MSDVTVTKIILSKHLVEQIKAEIANSVDELGCDSDAGGNAIMRDEIEKAVLNVLIPLRGNRIVSGIDEGEQIISPEEFFNNPNVRLTPLSLIPVTYFIGQGSCYVASTIGSSSNAVKCRL